MKWAVATVAFLVLASPMASADPWREGRALLTCYPGTGHFELLTKQQYPEGIAPELGEVERPRAYSPSELEDTPFRCELPGHTIVVEGRNQVSGKGYCGVRAGAQVRVLIDGKPVAYRFEAIDRSHPSSIDTLSAGWIELSDCFERNQSVTIQSTSSSINVELCRLQEMVGSAEGLVTPLAGACKIWPKTDPTFNGQ